MDMRGPSGSLFRDRPVTGRAVRAFEKSMRGPAVDALMLIDS